MPAPTPDPDDGNQSGGGSCGVGGVGLILLGCTGLLLSRRRRLLPENQ